MVQGDVRPEPESQASGTRDRSSSSRVWPGILLIVVILIAILLLWWYSQRPELSPLTAQKETAVVTNEVRPEPTVPSTPTVASADEPDDSRVPNVVGHRKREAEDALRSAGYAVRASNVQSVSRASGLVVAQSPGGGTEMESGGIVVIVVSIAAQSVSTATMPNVVGLTQSSAESKVEAAGLIPYLIYGDHDVVEGLVISQWPDAGESVPEGSEGFIQVQLNN